MGKLGRKVKRDVWHVRLPDDTHLIVMGAAPKGARIMAEGPGSAYKTAQAIGAGLSREIAQVHGAVKARVTPTGTSKGASIRFTPRSKTRQRKATSPSFRVGRARIYYKKTGSGTALSRRPIKG